MKCLHHRYGDYVRSWPEQPEQHSFARWEAVVEFGGERTVFGGISVLTKVFGPIRLPAVAAPQTGQPAR
jgi:hypothetical protein